MRTVHINTAKPYDVVIGYGMLSTLGDTFRSRLAPCRIALVSDETVYGLYGGVVESSLARVGYTVIPCVIPPGEGSKSLATVGSLLERLAQHELSRSDLIVALGGGVVGDIAGFTAAMYLRGIEYVQIPTTLLAAVDSSVGGKTGVNLPQGKNMAGAFWQPRAVYCDLDTFNTLPTEVFLDGVAESLKYGVICDRALFEQVSRGALDGDSMDTVTRCVQIKAELVQEDERDNGQRQLLNLGHTIGHAIEVLSEYKVSHGHAIAMGMVGAARIAEGLGLCVMGCAGILMAMLDRLGLPVETNYEPAALARVVASDKKRKGDTVTMVLPQAIGKCILYPVKVDQLENFFRMSKGERI